jgi:hypothetical protein
MCRFTALKKNNNNNNTHLIYLRKKENNIMTFYLDNCYGMPPHITTIYKIPVRSGSTGQRSYIFCVS